MKKIALTDGSGHWFDADCSKKFRERPEVLEEMRRSQEGDPCEEALYLTERGTFVLYTFDAHCADLYFVIDQTRASKWLVANGYQAELAKLELQTEEAKLQL